MKQYWLVLLISFVCLPALKGQKDYIYNFDRYANEQGLSQGQVFDIAQDQSGQIWIATYGGGITVLDGFQQHYYSLEHGLPSYSTTSLFRDSENRMWIGTINGPCYYDGYSIKTPHIHENLKNLFVWDIRQDNKGKIWFATGKGIWYLKNDTLYPENKKLMQYPFYRIARQPGTGHLWFTSGATDFRILKNDRLTKTQLPVLPEVFIEDLYFLNRKDFYGITTKGLYRFRITSTDTMLWSRKFASEHFISISQDSKNRLWLGTSENGIFIIDKWNKTHNINAHQGIGHSSVPVIFRDKQKRIWIGTDGAGAALFKGFKFAELYVDELYKPSFVMDVHIDKSENIWIATEGQGLAKVTDQKTSVYTLKNGLSNDFVTDIDSDQSGSVYAGTYNGITIFKNKSKQYLRKHSGLVSNTIESLMIDSKNRLWVGTHGVGLQCFNDKMLFSSANGLVDDVIWDIFEDTSGKIYAATGSGVNIIKNKTIIDTLNQADGMLNEIVGAIAQDRYGNMWFASERGLSWYNQKQLKYYPIDDFSDCQIIYSIVIDKFDRIMLGTENGIISIETDRKGNIHNTFHYSKNAGFFGIECNANAVTKDTAGNIFWGTVNGVTRHIPQKKYQTINIAAPNINSVELSDENEHLMNYADSISPFKNLPINLRLPYKSNNITIHFSAPEFFYKEKLLFRYKLKGLEEDWSKPVDQTKVSYNNLPPGNYTFSVQTLHKDYPKKTSTTNHYSFTIKTPLYHTWWFRIILSVFLIAIVLLLWNYRIYALKTRKIKLQRLVRERTLQLSKQKNELESAYKEIKRSANLKEEFLANTSHEMRTPLNVVIGYSNLVLNTNLSKQQKSYMENVRSSGEHLKIIINDLLDLSKIEADSLTLNNTTFDYKRVLINTFNIFRIEAENKGLKPELKIQRPVHQIIGDPVRLTQILSNLLRNAIKFTEKGYIKVSTYEKQTGKNHIALTIEVKDSGIGIPEEKIQNIFQSFTQVTGKLTRKYGGTGLGLAIVDKLVHLHNGKIDVDSKPNKGTLFRVTLPYDFSEKPETLNKEDHKISEDQNLNKIRVLIVDDNEINLSLAIETLHHFNQNISTDVAYNGEEAILKHKNNEFDLIIMDIQMPVMDGYEATRKIRQSGDNKNKIPILGMTAHAMKDERTKCLDLGMDEYLSKPFSPNELLKKIKLVLNINGTLVASDTTPKTEHKPLQYLNINKIKAIVGDSREKEIKYLQLLLKNVPDLIAKIENGLNQKHLENAKVAAHSLKSTFRYYGADKLMEHSRKIEEMAGNGDPKFENILQEIKTKWHKVQEEVNQYLKSF